MEWYPSIEGLCWSFVYFFTIAAFDYVDYVFWVAASGFIYSEFYFQFFKCMGFYFYNYITYSASFILAFGNSLCCVFSKCRSGEYSFILFLQEKRQEQNTDLYLTYVDLTKVFCMFSKDGLWRIMAKYGYPKKFISIIRQFHDGMHVRVHDNRESSVAFPITNGFKHWQLGFQSQKTSSKDQDEAWYCQQVSVHRQPCTERYYQSQHAKWCWLVLNGLWQFWPNHQHKKDRRDAPYSA